MSGQRMHRMVVDARGFGAFFFRAITERPVSARRIPWWFYPVVVLVMGGVYGAVTGSWDIAGDGRWRLVPYAAIKVPLLILSTTAICLPAYFVLATVLGVRNTFRTSLAAIVAGQAAMTTALASLSPITGFVYICGVSHQQALVLSSGMFSLATLAATAVMLGRFRPLIQADRRNRLCLIAWVVMYVFVGIQSGWMLRPFVGSPGLQVSFFREGAFSNAYIAVVRIVDGAIRGSPDYRTDDSSLPASE